MSDKNPTNAQSVNQLIQDLEDGEISPKDASKLFELMRKNPAALDLYVKHMKLVALLKASASARADLGALPVNGDIARRKQRKKKILSMSLGLAALLIIGLFFLPFNPVNTSPNVSQDLITMTGSADADFSVIYHDDEKRQKQKLLSGDRVKLSRGNVRLEYPSGVEAIIEGPTELTLVSNSELTMTTGSAWFRVPKEGIGFSASIGQLRVVDLGTEFGLIHGQDDTIQIHVEQGKVQINPIQKPSLTMELTTGKSMQFDAKGKGSEIDFDTSHFLKSFDPGIPYLHWSFDALKNDAYEASGSIAGVHSYQAELRSINQIPKETARTNCQADGKFGKSFSMNGKGWYAQSAFPGIGGGAPRTFAAWIRHRRDFSMPRTPYCCWGSRSEYGRSWKVSIWKQDSHTLWTSAFRPAVFSPITEDISNQWMHIASVFTGQYTEEGYPEIHHYINGDLQQTSPVPRETFHAVNTDISEESTKLRFGAAYNLTDQGFTVDGDIDEAYLFRGVLTQKQVRQLMETNTLDFFLSTK